MTTSIGELIMKKLLVGLLALGSISAFSSTINHSNCELNISNVSTTTAQQISLSQKGYSLYSGSAKEGTLKLELEADYEYTADMFNNRTEKSIYTISINKISTRSMFRIFETDTSYSNARQETGKSVRRKSQRAMKRLFKRLPKCSL